MPKELASIFLSVCVLKLLFIELRKDTTLFRIVLSKYLFVFLVVGVIFFLSLKVIKPIFCDCFLVCVLKFFPFSLISLMKMCLDTEFVQTLK